MEQIFEFNAEIKDGGEKWPSAACIYFPYDVKASFGSSGMIKVKATFDGVPYRGSLANMGTGHILIMRKDIRAKVGKSHGEIVHVTIQKDTEERIVEIPEALARALDENKDIRVFYDSLSYTNRKEYAQWISAAKKQETKDRRLAKAIELLKGGVKHP